MEAIEKKFITFLKRIGRFFAANWITGIIALFCALVLWGFVLTNQNPERTKTLSGVKLSFEGESDLIARKLVVYGNMNEILPDVTVKVNTELLNYTALSSSDITATVSLRNISTIGEHTLDVHAVSSTGAVVSVSPSTVTVTVDRLSTKLIPVEISTAGVEDESYWYSAPAVANDEIEIEGALTALSTINRAVGVIDISDRYEAFSDAVTLSLLDANGDTVDSSILYGNVPSVKVQMDILPQKTVPFDLEGAITGLDQLPETYEIASMFTQPGNVTIVGEKSVLDTVDSLRLSTLDILALLDKMNTSEAIETESLTLNIIVPDERIRIIGDWTTVEAYIVIGEKTISTTFKDVPVSIINAENAYKYSIENDTMDVTVTGRVTQINSLNADDIHLYVDMAHLAPGTHKVYVKAEPKNSGDLLLGITYEPELSRVSVTVTEK